VTFRSVLFGAALSCGLALASAAGAATIVATTTRANVEAVTGLTGGALIDFEGITPGYRPELTTQGVTFKASVGNFTIENQYAGRFSLEGQSLKSVIDKRLDFSFAEAITGFGFFFGASDLVWTLTAYDNKNKVLDTLQIAPTVNSNAGNFYGIVAPGIARATLTTTSADYVGIDDFRTSTAPVGGVPEPASWAMMILGFGAVGALMRRRSPLVATA
jgi:hypothetical protein